MDFNHTLSAILRGHWFIDKTFANAYMPTLVAVLSGKSNDFGFPKMFKDEESQEEQEARKNPQAVEALSSQSNVYSIRPYTDITRIQNGSIALVNISGPMLKNGGYCSYGMLDTAAMITRLGLASNVSAIIVEIDSPGGQVYGTATLADAIKAVDAIKPVVGISNDGMVASAAMWVASSCREIYAVKKTDRFGSIGVYSTLGDFKKQSSELFKLDIIEVYAPQSGDKNKTYDDAIAGNDGEMKKELSVLAAEFIQTIKTNRSGKLKNEDWSTGKMFYSTDATKMGLIDGIKSFEQIVQRTNSLIKSSSKNSLKNMSTTQKAATEEATVAFPKTLAVAGAQEFAITDEGFTVEEASLRQIEASLTELDAIKSELTTVKNSVVEKDSAIIGHLQTIETHQATIKTNNSKIKELEAEIATLKNGASGSGTIIGTSGDDNNDDKPVASYLDPNSAINKMADRRTGRK